MSTILRQVWRNTEVGRPIRRWYPMVFDAWSDPIFGEGDPSATDFGTGFWNWLGKAFKWKKFLVLTPRGPLETKFVIAFKDEHGNCMYSSRIRKVADGPFMMRMGPANCKFFVVSIACKLRLEPAAYVRGGIDLY